MCIAHLSTFIKFCWLSDIRLCSTGRQRYLTSDDVERTILTLGGRERGSQDIPKAPSSGDNWSTPSMNKKMGFSFVALASKNSKCLVIAL